MLPIHSFSPNKDSRKKNNVISYEAKLGQEGVVSRVFTKFTVILMVIIINKHHLVLNIYHML